MSQVSKLGYLEVDEETLNKYEKEEKLDIKQELLVESQYIYFNSTNEGDILIYNKLSNVLFRLNSNEIFEYQLPKLYETEFSCKPLYLIMYINTKEETNNYIIFLAYIQQDDINSQKLLVFREINVEKDEDNGNHYKWNEIDYIETKIHIENNQILRGIIWWEDSPNDEEFKDQYRVLNSNQQKNSFNGECYPSILMITNHKLILFSLKEHGIHPIWQINENNLQLWYNMEFQCLLLQTGTNILTPFINIGMNPKQKPIKLQPLELILNSEIRQQDIFLLNVYQNLYCVHIDYSNKRISLRDLFNQDSSDLVLDIGDTFQEFTLMVIDNIIVVVNLHGKKIFGLFDIKLVKDNNNSSKKNKLNSSQNQSENGNSSNLCHYYIVPTLFSDEFNDNTIICLYENNKNEIYMKSLKKIKSYHLNNYYIILINSSCNLVIKLDLNKIQYSRLGLCSKLLIDNIIITKNNINTGVSNDKNNGYDDIVNIEKMDILPFISNRSLSWDNVLLEKIKLLFNKEKEHIMNKENDHNNYTITYPKILTLLMEIIKVKIDLKIKISQEYYSILLEIILLIKRESLLQYVLQYHIIEDSNKILKELYNMYLFNKDEEKLPNETNRGHVRFNSKVLDEHDNNNVHHHCNYTSKYFKIKNISWLEQICLDTAYRMNNIKILVDILIYRKEYRRAIKILREKCEQKVIVNINNKEISIKKIILTLSKNNQACKYPIYNILYTLGNDIEYQKNDQSLLGDIIKEIQNWINEYFDQVNKINEVILNNRTDSNSIEKYNFSIVGKPKIDKCNIWLPELINLKDLNENDDENTTISDCEVEKNNSNNNANYSTFESIYISATESNEAFIIADNDEKQNNSSCNEDTLKSISDSDFINNNNNGKSPLLHHEPGFLSLSSIYIKNSSDSSSYTSDSSSSFNSYE
ncbi:uncharacterized protein cubi_02190 [Cryptosporidium ubiquitum]|uniref:Mic1 domain-containing protein n=1 Tax=Cryptosporidium ubiquitum TaxID=857276 RepID=A0A1J4MG22_9CRYT|nr:uncharacterized protein cubi_02190 [Cryptosporidium ubiquitum]OII72959.1 hypothetical protein cubi_02190 [Cryptosporidium ubiquitum]